MSERRMVRTEALSWWSDEEQPLADFVSLVRGIWDSISDERRSTAKVEFRGGESSGRFIISYYRPETDEEMAGRAAANEKYLAERVAYEIAELQRLLAKHKDKL